MGGFFLNSFIYIYIYISFPHFSCSLDAFSYFFLQEKELAEAEAELQRLRDEENALRQQLKVSKSSAVESAKL